MGNAMGGAVDYIQFVFMPQVFNGLTIGVAVILMALGLTIIFGLLDVINMAHGEFYALGAYLGVTLASQGAGYWLALIAVPLVLLPLGYGVDRLLIQRVFHQKDRHMLTLLLTFGLAIVMEDVFKLAYGPNTIRPETPVSGGTELFGNFLPQLSTLPDGLRDDHHRGGLVGRSPDPVRLDGAGGGIRQATWLPLLGCR